MDRRTVLATLAAGGGAALAGCLGIFGGGGGVPPGTGDGGEDGEGTTTHSATTRSITTVEGPARFADARIDGPSAATVGETATVTAAVANVGGEPGDFSGTLRAVDGPTAPTWEVEVEDVPPGERGSATLGVTLDSAGDYVLELDGAGPDPVTHGLTVRPVRAGVDETVEIGEGVRAALRSVSFPWAFPYRKDRGRYPDTRGVADAPTGKVFAATTWEFENTGTESATVERSEFLPADGSVLSEVGSVDMARVSSDGARILAADGLDLQAAGTATRRLLVQFDREAARDGVAVGVQRDGADTPADVVFEATPDGESFAFPSVDLVGFDHPGTLEADSPTGTVHFGVENAGEVPATFHGAIQWRDERDGEWKTDLTLSPAAFSARLEPGDRREFTGTWNGDPAATGTYTYRIAPFAPRFELTFE